MTSLLETTGLTREEMQEPPSLIINAFDRKHTILFWNNRCASHFGIRPEDAAGRKLEEVLPWVKTDERLLHIDRALMGKTCR